MDDGNGGDQKKGFWDIVDIVIKPLGGLLTALAIAYIGHSLNASLVEQQMLDSNYRLYTQLMSQREEAESNLRKDMFKSIIESFMASDRATIESNVLNLELLTQNFHESLNIKPLFMHLKRKIEESDGYSEKEKSYYMKRLFRVAQEITRKQRVILETHGIFFEPMVTWDSESESNMGQFLTDTMQLAGIDREIQLMVTGRNVVTQELEVSLIIITSRDSASSQETEMIPESASYDFGLSFFDFPMIDNIRLSHDHRCAVVLNNFESWGAELTVMLFPGKYASMKEKRYYQDLIQDLRNNLLTAATGKN